MKKYAPLLFSLLCTLLVTGAGCTQSSQKVDKSTTVQQSTKETTADVKTQEKEPTFDWESYDFSSIDYTVVDTEDLSFSDVKRLSIKVVVTNNPTSKEMIQALSYKILSEHPTQDAISIIYYFDESQVDEAYTLAKADWAPNGKWSQASTKTNQRFSFSYTNNIGKTRITPPTTLELEINSKMKALWYDMMETSPTSVSDEDVARILAPKYGKSVNEMLEIRMRVSNYEMGL